MGGWYGSARRHFVVDGDDPESELMDAIAEVATEMLAHREAPTDALLCVPNGANSNLQLHWMDAEQESITDGPWVIVLRDLGHALQDASEFERRCFHAAEFWTQRPTDNPDIATLRVFFRYEFIPDLYSLTPEPTPSSVTVHSSTTPSPGTRLLRAQVAAALGITLLDSDPADADAAAANAMRVLTWFTNRARWSIESRTDNDVPTVTIYRSRTDTYVSDRISIEHAALEAAAAWHAAAPEDETTDLPEPDTTAPPAHTPDRDTRALRQRVEPLGIDLRTDDPSDADVAAANAMRAINWIAGRAQWSIESESEDDAPTVTVYDVDFDAYGSDRVTIEHAALEAIEMWFDTI